METCTWEDLCAMDGEREKWRLKRKLAEMFKGAVCIYVESDGNSGFHIYAERGLFRPTKHEHVTNLTPSEIEESVPHPSGRRKNGVPVFYR